MKDFLMLDKPIEAIYGPDKERVLILAFYQNPSSGNEIAIVQRFNPDRPPIAIMFMEDLRPFELNQEVRHCGL